MTDKELRKLSRRELLELLIEQTRRADELEKKLQEAKNNLKSRDIDIDNAGSIAEAALKLNGIFEAAEKAASQYVHSVKKTGVMPLKREEHKKHHTEEKQKPKAASFSNPALTEEAVEDSTRQEKLPGEEKAEKASEKQVSSGVSDMSYIIETKTTKERPQAAVEKKEEEHKEKKELLQEEKPKVPELATRPIALEELKQKLEQLKTLTSKTSEAVANLKTAEREEEKQKTQENKGNDYDFLAGFKFTV